MSGFADFPLAKGLSAVVDPLTPGIVDGTGSVLLDQVTPVTSELLRFWFQRDYCDTRADLRDDDLITHVGAGGRTRGRASNVRQGRGVTQFDLNNGSESKRVVLRHPTSQRDRALYRHEASQRREVSAAVDDELADLAHRYVKVPNMGNKVWVWRRNP